MPNFPIIDAHVHLWEPTKYRVPWLDNIPKIGGTYGIPEYKAATAGLDLQGFVYLEIDIAKEYVLSEARWLSALAETEPLVQGIVPYAPIEYGNLVRPYLEELVAIGPKIKGIRRITQAEADSEFCLRPGFVEGTKLLPEYGLSFDLCFRDFQFSSSIELIRQAPETSFIIDHHANPDIKSGQFESWSGHVTEAASFPNVAMKISGILSNVNPENWSIDDVKPYTLHALEAFGEDRVVFGSDWPVVTLTDTYKRWVEVLDTLTDDLSDSAKRKLWSENARRFYRL